MLVKDLKPKYTLIELIIDKGTGKFTCQWSNKDILLNKYGDYIVESSRDFTDTKSTSVIIKMPEA